MQVAALAGGIAVAPFAPALKSPWGAILTGVTAAIFSLWAFVYLQPKLAHAKFFDSSAVFSANVVPGFIAAIGSAIAFARVNGDYNIDQINALLPSGRSALYGGGYQIAFWCITVVFAAISGFVSGAVLNLPIFENKSQSVDTHNDDHDDFAPVAEVRI